MIDVVCVLFEGSTDTLPEFSAGTYSPKWADRLYRAVKRNTNHEVNFTCLVDKIYEFEEPIEAIPLLKTSLGWGNIMEAFRPDLGENLRFIVGLDTIIKGSLDEIFSYQGECGLLQDPYHTDTICNGVGLFSQEQCAEFWDDWWGNLRYWQGQAKYGGRLSEMEFLRQKVGSVADRLDHLFPDQIQSYKVHYKNAPEQIKDHARVVYFHGRPKMHELKFDDPLLENWK